VTANWEKKNEKHGGIPGELKITENFFVNRV
jgi:hypothetical protein